jgi:undecaprenyl-diphosphatase
MGDSDTLVGSPPVDDGSPSLGSRRRLRWGRQASLASGWLSAVGGFVAVHRAVVGGRGNAFDRAVVRAMGRGRRPLVNAIVRAITWLGSVNGSVAISVSAVVLARRRPRSAAQVAAGAVGGILAELFFKRLFRRKRPELLEHLEVVRSTSFPSGHAMAAASLYLTLAFVASRSRALGRRRATLLFGTAALATTVGATRVYLGVHWPTDVLGGLALGTAWACATESIFDATSSAG